MGNITRGTTNPNRMRRLDRWLTGPQAWRLRAAADPLVVDLGYGASPATAVELFERLSVVRPDVRVVGIEIEPERVRLARELERPGLSFQLGGFELPVAGRPVLVRAFNVLRQYEEADVAAIWRLVQGRLAPGRAVHRRHLRRDRPPGHVGGAGRRAAAEPEPVHAVRQFCAALGRGRAAAEGPHPPERSGRDGSTAFLQAMDQAWLEAAPLASFGNRQRWTAMCRALLDGGWPVQDGPSRWRLGELTVGWDACGTPRVP